MTKFTKGEWKADNKWVVCGGLLITQCNDVGGYDERGMEIKLNNCANAKLIAAAPDLFNALQDIVAGLNEAEDTMPLIRGSEVKNARAALAKATE